MRIWTFLGKRPKHLWLITRRRFKFCLFTLFAFIIVGYIMVVTFVQEIVRNIHGAGYSWNVAKVDPVQVEVNFVESYCRHREQTASEGHISRTGFLHWPKQKHNGKACIHPKLDPCDPSIAGFDHKVRKVECSSEQNWVYVDNGTFRISSWARWKYGKITCEYAPIVRGRGDYSARHAEHIKPMLDGSPLVSDFFKVACISPSGKRYHNIHAGVAYNESLHSRSRDTQPSNNALRYDVFMFGFDSTSRMAWMRNLPKTRDYFLRELDGIELEGYNIVGDGTVQALLPILTGKTERELPTARRGVQGATEVDSFPWIWDLFKQAGYVTAWAEDMAYIGTFQMRLKGFQEQPTDHSMRTYFLLAEPMYHRFLPWCVGSEVRHVRFLNWFKDLYHMYGNRPKFMFGFHSEYSHNSNNDLKKIDEDLHGFLKYLHSSDYLNHTILILMGDHGARFSDIRSTPQGKLEERMPYFAFSFPPSLAKSHPEIITNFTMNSKRLTTPFDIHETFHSILNLREIKDHTNKRGVSLFQEVPENRTCKEAGAEPHWCACLEWEEQGMSDRKTAEIVTEAVVKFINSLTSHVRKLCALLKVQKIIGLSKFSPNAEVLRFKQSSDRHGDLPDMSDNMTLDYHYFQVALVTEPGEGKFEVTAKHSTVTGEVLVGESDISRTNRYNSPSCIQDMYPNLRPYCICI